MKTRDKFLMDFISILLLLTGLSVYAQKAPVDEHGEMSIELIHSIGDEYRCDVWYSNTAGILEDYEKRFGAFPLFMIWEDVDDPVNVGIEIYFRRNAPDGIRFHPPKPHYSTKMTWGDARKFFYWRLKNYKTGVTSFYPLTQGEKIEDKCVVYSASPHSWIAGFGFDAREFPVPNDGCAYEVSLELYNEEPKDTSEIPLYRSDYFQVIRTTRSTPLDTLQWAEYSNRLENDYDLGKRLLQYFPNSRRLLDLQMYQYYKNGNADSLKYYARRYIQVLADRSDPHYTLYFPNGEEATAPRPITKRDYDSVQDIVKKVTGDTLDIGPIEFPPEESPYNSMEFIE